MYVFGVPHTPERLRLAVVEVDMVLLLELDAVSFGGYFLGLPRFPLGLGGSKTVFFAFAEYLLLFLGFVTAFLPGLVPVLGSGVGLQLGEVDRLQEVGLRTSLSELSTDLGLLREDDEVPPKRPPLPPPPDEPRAGLESNESRE